SYKINGKLKRLVVTGCLAERYQKEVLKLLPEVDACLGSRSFDKVVEAIRCEEVFEEYKPLTCCPPEYDRMLTTGNKSVYLRIAEGCSNHCSYCVIPSVRGEFMPRSYESIMKEAKKLAENGAIEINLIAQDTTKHPDLCRLIEDIAKIDSVHWIRILYCRPEEITDELLHTMAKVTKCVPYIDVPLQHASGKILKKMNRSGNDESLTELMSHIRDILPDCSIRTTFITGFPTESEEDFEILCNFVKTNRFANLGVFPYSREEGTPAGRMRGQIDEEVKQRRADLVMEIQHRLLPATNEPLLGKTLEVLCEGQAEDGSYVGRAYFQAPEVDGQILFTSENPIEPGAFVPVLLEKYNEYDFYGTAVFRQE
ncbi:MAG: MiaB/RimO family radical SAM methylthiotransferase, partial [Clostridia bacterium]|nr:MiaB/RimO family radical SAM methylthiotransferase [Clostridia bacterium]